MASFDIHSPQQMGAIVRRLTNFGEALPEHIAQAGREWYPHAHDLARGAAREMGISTRQAAGAMAAVSPNMDWDNNISVFHQLHDLSDKEWEMIESSTSKQGRTSDVMSMLGERAPALARASDRDLLRARRIVRGEDFETVMPRTTAPKTNSFAKNILNPEGPEVTVDSRHHDIIANTMLGWEAPRNIGSASLSRGSRASYRPDLSRYERMELATQMAQKRMSSRFPSPNSAQAAIWLGAKEIEKSLPTATGSQRRVGMPRRGQPYTSGTGEPIDYGHLNWVQLG